MRDEATETKIPTIDHESFGMGYRQALYERYSEPRSFSAVPLWIAFFLGCFWTYLYFRFSGDSK